MAFNICLCIPQLYGLMIMASVKLYAEQMFAYSASIVGVVCWTIANLLLILVMTDKDFLQFPVFSIAMMFMILQDLVFNIICLIGCYKKNYRLLRSFSRYSIGMLVLNVFSTILLLARPKEWPTTLIPFIFQVYCICLTENVIIELKYEKKINILRHKKAEKILLSIEEGNVKPPIEQCHGIEIRVNQPIELCHENEKCEDQPIEIHHKNHKNEIHSNQ